MKSESGVVVARRAVPGSSLDEFYGRGVVAAPIPRLLGVLFDAPHRTEWSDRCKGSRELQRLGGWSQVIYDRTSATWPAKDRDVVLRVDATFDVPRSAVIIEFHSVPDSRVPPIAGVVRMRSVNGRWVLRPVGDGSSTQVEYQVRADPGGDLPAWLANDVSEHLPEKTILGLRKQVTKRSYPAYEATVSQRPDVAAIMAHPVAPAQP